ncbi:MAG: DUF2905 domain-containing protein [Nitrospirae bacterium]|nr:DUF2905 domain-containing protein [Nitrospirota bacterium]
MTFIITVVEPLGSMGKLFIIFGIIMLAVGGIMFFVGRIPWIGRLPGDIYIQRRNFTVYLPLTTSIIISILLSLFLWFFSRR